MYAHGRIPTGLFLRKSEWRSTFTKHPELYALDMVGREMIDVAEMMVALIDVCCEDQIQQAVRNAKVDPETLLSNGEE